MQEKGRNPMKPSITIFFTIIIFFTLQGPIADTIPLLIDIQPRDFPNSINRLRSPRRPHAATPRHVTPFVS